LRWEWLVDAGSVQRLQTKTVCGGWYTSDSDGLPRSDEAGKIAARVAYEILSRSIPSDKSLITIQNTTWGYQLIGGCPQTGSCAEPTLTAIAKGAAHLFAWSCSRISVTKQLSLGEGWHNR
jgi:hypothetical protein